MAMYNPSVNLGTVSAQASAGHTVPESAMPVWPSLTPLFKCYLIIEGLPTSESIRALHAWVGRTDSLHREYQIPEVMGGTWSLLYLRTCQTPRKYSGEMHAKEGRGRNEGRRGPSGLEQI